MYLNIATLYVYTYLDCNRGVAVWKQLGICTVAMYIIIVNLSLLLHVAN